MKRNILYLFSAVIIFFLIGLGFLNHRFQTSPQAQTLQGWTMGTEYHIVLPDPGAQDLEGLKDAITARLEEINQIFSTWREDSEVSKINQGPYGKWIPISEELDVVLRHSLQLSKKTGGAFDVTIGPLVNLWGFGPYEEFLPPSPEEIQEARRSVGYEHLTLGKRRLQKTLPHMYLDFSAVAKGYGVDAIARLIEGHGLSHYSVEIGGEVVVKGLNPRRRPWTIGIETPTEGAPYGADFISALSLGHGAIATSGSYRIYREEDPQKGSHIIDPDTGEALQTDLVSVTVQAPTCLEADALATALMVMGAEKGLAWVEKQPGIEALFLVKKGPSRFDQVLSKGFPTPQK
ncbi:MAG: hypothetical protein A3I75_07315 [Deltaproteobacteria bacterium RIFCSPLOWO2_02_FULL_50_16]|nr:MAG: hypothetical protein A3B79_03660 [Deltaproteobacteria bacterium RIFCSPHIGHO2_02_FULL_50_15]OGQ58093.1 MAG: hypothetical protein A3I75_07315 [Deltaproteobacteria bacterium RIFCSPLOWO2_02_FULL_50_16]OGQ69020.1 MAG: hypothetical protein A3F89_04910 [Deltaproteobacteria bacterium RIFCSPLOWO2_12_FULL_50_11]